MISTEHITKPYLTFASLMLCSSAKSLCRLGMHLLKFLALFIIYSNKKEYDFGGISIFVQAINIVIPQLCEGSLLHSLINICVLNFHVY